MSSKKALKRFILPPDFPLKEIDSLFLWGQENSAGAVIVPPEKADLKSGKELRGRTKLIFEKASQYGFDVEAGGWELSRLVPRKYFFFNKEMFRMENGKRLKHIHFCPTNPDTIRILKHEAEKSFRSFPEVSVFHLWPDKNYESVWCNCPACRAFSFAEQNIIAVNAAADVLAKIHSKALLSYFKINDDTDEKPKIKTRDNLFAIEYLDSGSEIKSSAGSIFIRPIDF